MATKRRRRAGDADLTLIENTLHRVGPAALRNDELLALLLYSTETGENVLHHATKMLKRCPLKTLVTMPLTEMVHSKHLDEQHAAMLVAAFELAKRGLNKGLGVMPSLARPTDLLPVIADIKDKKKEHIVAVFLNGRNQMLRRETIAIGTLTSSLVHPREVFSPAVGLPAASVVVAHNHPSGDVTPTTEDIEVTKRLAQAGEILGICLLDHLIIGSERYLSFREEKLI
jgi:DNA repair protein RadC